MNFSPFALIRNMRAMRDREREMAEHNPHLAQAMEQEKMESHRLAVIARTFALSVVIVLLPFLNQHWDVLVYQFYVLLFIGLGWLQYRMANVGYSKTELMLIMLDLVLLTIIFTVPSPFAENPYPGAFQYRFDNFIYFFLILAVGTLAYSWRTVWSMGTWVMILWAIGVALVYNFGAETPELNDAVVAALEPHPVMAEELAPHSIQMDNRIQEVVVFMLVAGILAIKGYRSNLLLLKQADIAAERANLSRYFPSSMVDTLASTNNELGAVKNQDVAVLFTDIVGFTQYAERSSAEDVMDLLRDYNAFVEKAIFEKGGTLEKYIGDGVMATFGRPESSKDDAVNALRAAEEIMRQNDEMNKVREKEGKEPIKVSVGIHYGSVITGDIGPERRMEFAVVGDTVNVAARLESATRELDCDCVVSDALISKIDMEDRDRSTILGSFHPKGKVNLKGRSKPIDVWVS